MSGFVLRVVVCGLLLAAPFMLVARQAQEKLTEVEHLKLQLQIEKQTRLQAQYDAALAQALADFREQPLIRKLITESEQSRLVTNELVEKAFAEHQVDKVSYKLNIETGAFQEVEKK